MPTTFVLIIEGLKLTGGKAVANATNGAKNTAKIFKDKKANEDSTVRLKVRNILQNNNKLLRMFDNIYN